MLRRLLLTAAFVALVLPALAVIKVLTPLKQVLDAEEFIFVAEVKAVDAEKPSATFAFTENLKGKCDLASIPVNLTGDSYAKKDGHTKILLDRLAEKRQMIVFLSKTAKENSAFVFVEGTWFQMKGTLDGKDVRWAFLHCEPYFRRTFKGTTAELKAVVAKYVAKQGDPPAPDEKEPAGYGPVVEATPKKCGVMSDEFGVKNESAVGSGLHSSLITHHSSLFAVIPSFVLIGPLAILAALFPGLFAQLAVQFRRWRALLVVASTNSTLALAYYWGQGTLPNARWCGPTAFAGLLVAVAIVGMVWSGMRYRLAARAEPDVADTPAAKEVAALAGVTAGVLVLLGTTAYFLGLGGLLEQPWREFTALAPALAGATAYMLFRRATPSFDGPGRRLSLTGESVALAGVVAFGLAGFVGSAPTSADASSTVGDINANVEVFPFDGADEVLSGVTVADSRLYFGTLKRNGFRNAGSVVCADAATGKPIWTFDDGGSLKPVFSTPAVAGGKVFVGEGLHTDADRRLFALDANTGAPAWQAQTTSHTEGGAHVADGRVWFAAGDDGLYCANAADGKAAWHTPGAERKLHIDTPPTLSGGRAFCGSGYNTLALLALDAKGGAELWRTPVNLRSFGKPLAGGEHVFYGLGTGNLVDDLSTEPEDGVPAEKVVAGAVMCVTAKAGAVVWRTELPKSVHTALAADAHAVFAACKDGSLYAFDRSTGKLRWKRALGASFASGPVLGTYAVYAVTLEGRVACVEPRTGEVIWQRPLAEPGVSVQVFSQIARHNGALYVGVGRTNANNGAKSAAVARIVDTVE